jgi:hypothetical protein
MLNEGTRKTGAMRPFMSHYTTKRPNPEKFLD